MIQVIYYHTSDLRQMIQVIYYHANDLRQMTADEILRKIVSES